MIVGIAVLEIFAAGFAQIFGLSGTTEDLYISATQIISVSLIFAGINISLQGAFQGLNAGKETLLISIMRQLIFVLPFAFLFSVIAKNNSNYMWTVWTTFIISESLSCIFAAAFMKKIYKNKVQKLND